MKQIKCTSFIISLGFVSEPELTYNDKFKIDVLKFTLVQPVEGNDGKIRKTFYSVTLYGKLATDPDIKEEAFVQVTGKFNIRNFKKKDGSWGSTPEINAKEISVLLLGGTDPVKSSMMSSMKESRLTEEDIPF